MSRQGQHIEKVFETVTSGRAAAQSRLAASWQRSFQKYQLDPSSRTGGPDIDIDRLGDRRAELGEMLQLASPRLDDLFRLIGHCGCGVVLTDADGVILETRFGDAETGAFNNWGLRPGADWSEAGQGTNGIGTCLAEGRAVTIHRDQHYLVQNIGMSCMDAPVFGPDGRIVAALDVSSARADQTEGFNNLIAMSVAQVAQQIEGDLFRAAYGQARIVLAGDRDARAASLVAVDADDIIVGATREARRALDLEREGPIKPRPVRDVLGGADGPAGLQQAERAAVKRALARADGNVTAAAAKLGIGRATLYRRMKRLGIAEERSKLSQD